MSRRPGTFFGDPGMRGNGPPNIDGMVTLKVDNVPYNTSVDDLRRTFEKYGELGDVYMPRDLRTGEPRGFAFVRYMSQRDADDAIDRLDGEFFAGRELRIQYAKRRRPEFGGGGGGGGGHGGGRGGGGYGGGGGRYRDDRHDDGYRRNRRSRSRSRSRGRRSRSRSPVRRRSRSRSPVRRSHRSRSRSASPRRERRRRGSSAEDRRDGESRLRYDGDSDEGRGKGSSGGSNRKDRDRDRDHDDPKPDEKHPNSPAMNGSSSHLRRDSGGSGDDDR